jgi:zinc D-Ala-D-Ala carboxypeptidase
MQLTKNFDLQELTKSQVALRMGLDNTPNDSQTKALKTLCEKALQPIRNAVGPVVVNSGFRAPKVNAATGGSETSDHCKGEAADIEAIEFDNLQLAKWIKVNLKFDQLILECYTPGDPRSGWVHVSYAEVGNRNQVLTAYRVDGKMKYEAGLKEAS